MTLEVLVRGCYAGCGNATQRVWYGSSLQVFLIEPGLGRPHPMLRVMTLDARDALPSTTLPQGWLVVMTEGVACVLTARALILCRFLHIYYHHHDHDTTNDTEVLRHTGIRA